MRLSAQIVFAIALIAGLSRPATAQSNVTNSDIQRLQDSIDLTSRDVAQLRPRDPGYAAQLQEELEGARDDLAHFSSRLRRNQPIARSEYLDLRDSINSIRMRARADDGPVVDSRDVPEGTQFDVRLQTPLSSATAQVEDRVDATTVVDLRREGRVVVPAGSLMRGVVTSVDKAGHVDRTGSLTIAFDRLMMDRRSYPIRATVVDALESDGRAEAGKVGAGAGVGAILGAILGGGKGAAAGLLIGGGGMIAATEGRDVDLRPGTVLRVALDAPLDVP
jgi:hypothetical protein